MNDKLSPETLTSEIKVKRINRIPMMIFLIIGMCVMIAFVYLIHKSGTRKNDKANNKDQIEYSVDKTFAKNLLAGKQQHGVIEAEKIKPSEPEPLKKSVKPKPQTNNEMTLNDKIRKKLLEKKLKLLESAIDAPPIVDKGEFNQNSDLITPANSSNQVDVKDESRDRLDFLRDKHAASRSGIPDDDQNKQKRKEAFFIEDQPETEYLQHTRRRQRSPLEVKTGTVIPATMLSGLNSDLPGMILAQVSQNVYDTATGGYLLIPQGTRLVGTYDSYIAYGQSRALAKWNRLIYPDGSTLELEGMPGTDQAGYAGLMDQVDHHYLKIFGSSLMIAIITGAYDFSQDSASSNPVDEQTVGDALSSAVARELAQTGQMLLKKNLNIQPTIKIRPGYKLNVMIQRDIIFPSVW